jgi:hypothetical protein
LYSLRNSSFWRCSHSRLYFSYPFWSISLLILSIWVEKMVLADCRSACKSRKVPWFLELWSSRVYLDPCPCLGKMMPTVWSSVSIPRSTAATFLPVLALSLGGGTVIIAFARHPNNTNARCYAILKWLRINTSATAKIFNLNQYYLTLFHPKLIQKRRDRLMESTRRPLGWARVQPAEFELNSGIMKCDEKKLEWYRPIHKNNNRFDSNVQIITEPYRWNWSSSNPQAQAWRISPYSSTVRTGHQNS